MVTLIAAILALANLMGIGGIAAGMVGEINAAVVAGKSVEEIKTIVAKSR